jgi:hypothetical protein
MFHIPQLFDQNIPEEIHHFADLTLRESDSLLYQSQNAIQTFAAFRCPFKEKIWAGKNTTCGFWFCQLGPPDYRPRPGRSLVT